MIKYSVRWLAVGLLAVGLSGCGSSYERYAAAMRDQLAVQEELVQVLKSVKDAASLKEAQAELKKLDSRAEETAARAKSLPKPSEDTLARLQEEFGPRRQELLNETLAEARRIEQLPGGADFIRSLKKFGGGTAAPAVGG
jgi:hypothetical protein